jgi:hypothetical protein
LAFIGTFAAAFLHGCDEKTGTVGKADALEKVRVGSLHPA